MIEDAKRLLDNICCIKESIGLLEEELQREKDSLMSELNKSMISEINAEYGKAMILSYTRGIVSKDKTEDILIQLQSPNGLGKPVSIDDCKNFKDCHYILVRRFENKHIPTWDKHRGLK